MYLTGPFLSPFAGVDAPPDEGAIHILPVPYDSTTSYEPGARWGPAALLNASIQLELYDEELGVDLSRQRIATLPPLEPVVSGPEDMVRAVEEASRKSLEQRKRLAVIGGEHTITVGVLRALRRRETDLTVLQLDAHADRRDAYQGSRYSHACTMARAAEMYPLAQVGIRSLSLEEAQVLDRERVIWDREIQEDLDGSLERLLTLLGDSVYVTIDLDVLDPAVFPSVGTPEPGGLDWYQITKILRRVGADRRIAGVDLTEHCPRPGLHAADYFAARLMAKCLLYSWGTG